MEDIPVQYASDIDGVRFVIVDPDDADMFGWSIEVADDPDWHWEWWLDESVESARQTEITRSTTRWEFTREQCWYRAGGVSGGNWNGLGFGTPAYPWSAVVDHGEEIVRWIPPDGDIRKCVALWEPAGLAPPVVVGQEAIDGPFAFTVGSVTAEDKTLQVHGPTPRGIFVGVVVSVKNLGTSSQSYSAEYQRLLDIEGREFPPHLDSMWWRFNHFCGLGRGPRADINPGDTVADRLIFDVPEGTLPSQYLLLLHSSLGSRGVIANLS